MSARTCTGSFIINMFCSFSATCTYVPCKCTMKRACSSLQHNQLYFLIESHDIQCYVRTEYLYKVQVNMRSQVVQGR